MIPQSDETDRARELLTGPDTGPAIRERVAAWGPLTDQARDELARLLQDGAEPRRST